MILRPTLLSFALFAHPLRATLHRYLVLMAIRVALYHRTSYSYDRLVNLGPQVIRLRPAPHTRTRITSHSLQVVPSKHFIHWQQDPHGNFLARLSFEQPTRRFEFTVDLVAEMEPVNPFDFFLEPAAEELPITYSEEQKAELAPCLEPTESGHLLKALVESVRPKADAKLRTTERS